MVMPKILFNPALLLMNFKLDDIYIQIAINKIFSFVENYAIAEDRFKIKLPLINTHSFW